eukprot:TRINITY_DN16557_c0_g1_i3.p1 TRINITY_DN16557_c0_g1~~TRINITY_DN16557_c0_g1_i3.p1  ORF type:complete len:383 (+),score=87.87 TRINITY_DN16557_c0_g1_i3:710-1858(+)
MTMKYLVLTEEYKSSLQSKFKEGYTMRRKTKLNIPPPVIRNLPLESPRNDSIVKNIEKDCTLTPAKDIVIEKDEKEKKERRAEKSERSGEIQRKEEKKFPRLVGLKNFGVNCYINAGLQCLLCIPELSEYFLHEKFASLNYETKSPTKPVCNMMASWYEEMFYGKRSTVSPKDFMERCPGGQQDAHEFFVHTLFPLVQRETDFAVKIQRNDAWNSEQVWSWYRNTSRNIFDELFGGLYKNTVVCKKCMHNSVTYDPFLGVSLTISGSHLYECLNKEFKEEKLPKCVGYKCLKCENKTAAVKREQIERPPKYLLLHLKRLIKNSTKVSDSIKYPLTLTLNDYCVNREDTTYSLIAVCVHLGGCYGGHFYCLGKREKKVICACV